MLEPNHKARWRLTRDVSLADLLAILCAAVAILFVYTDLNERVALLEAAVVEMKLEQARDRAELMHRFDRLDAKLDRLIERSNRL